MFYLTISKNKEVKCERAEKLQYQNQHIRASRNDSTFSKISVVTETGLTLIDNKNLFNTYCTLNILE